MPRKASNKGGLTLSGSAIYDGSNAFSRNYCRNVMVTSPLISGSVIMNRKQFLLEHERITRGWLIQFGASSALLGSLSVKSWAADDHDEMLREAMPN